LKEIILTVGLPCSGKTIFSKYIQGLKKNLMRVSISDIYKMVDNKYKESNSSKYLMTQESLILRLLEFGDVIVDNMHLTAMERASIIRPVKLVYPGIKVTVYQMARTLVQCKADNSKRSILDDMGYFSKVDDTIMDELNKSYELPQLNEAIDHIKGVQWKPSDGFRIGNFTVDHKPKIFEIASREVRAVSNKPRMGPSITMSDDE